MGGGGRELKHEEEWRGVERMNVQRHWGRVRGRGRKEGRVEGWVGGKIEGGKKCSHEGDEEVEGWVEKG